MATDAQFKANFANAQKSTGPASSSGKAASSKNHLITGLYTRLDYVKPEERDLYKEFYDTMFADLGAVTTLEQSYACEITSAAWRLRRCSTVEGELADYREQDPLLDEKAEKIIRSIERARAAAHAVMNRSINQLRKIQTERINRAEIDWAKHDFPPLADTKKLQSALAAQYRLDKQMRDLQEEAEQHAIEALMASNCKPAEPSDSQTSRPGLIPTNDRSKSGANGQAIPKVGRNTKCPCHSGKKFKQCCIGKAA